MQSTADSLPSISLRQRKGVFQTTLSSSLQHYALDFKMLADSSKGPQNLWSDLMRWPQPGCSHTAQDACEHQKDQGTNGSLGMLCFFPNFWGGKGLKIELMMSDQWLQAIGLTLWDFHIKLWTSRVQRPSGLLNTWRCEESWAPERRCRLWTLALFLGSILLVSTGCSRKLLTPRRESWQPISKWKGNWDLVTVSYGMNPFI